MLNVAKLLGRTAPPPIKNVKKVAMFNLLPTQIRKLANPRAPVKSVMASLQRNLAGFGQSGGEWEVDTKLVPRGTSNINNEPLGNALQYVSSAKS